MLGDYFVCVFFRPVIVAKGRVTGCRIEHVLRMVEHEMVLRVLRPGKLLEQLGAVVKASVHLTALA